MAKVKEEVVEEIIEEIVEQAPDVEALVRSLGAMKAQYAAIGVAVGVAAGAIGGFMLAMRKARKEAEEYITAEVSEFVKEMQAHYDAKVQALEARNKEPLSQVVQDLGYAPAQNGEVDVVEGEVTENAFDKDDPQPDSLTWDYEREAAQRGPVNPYIIHHDEFMVNEPEHEQVSLTYFSGDDVLVDERDQVIREVETVVGLEHLQKFGYGSEDEDMVYIRNPRLEVDYEISKSEGTFATEVHGFGDDELRHMQRSPRRVRFDDESRH